MTASRELDALGADAAALLAGLGAPVRASRPLTRIAAAGSRRASHRVELADGRVVKLRRVADPATATRITTALARAGDRFTTVLAHRGDAILEAWVDGTPLAELPPRVTRFREAAAILGRLHTRDGPPVEESTAVVLDDLEATLAEVVRLGGLDAEGARRLGQTARAHAPTRAAVGLSHTDFCAENLVVATDGHLRVVDCEALRRGPLDYDLARVRYRWPMSRRFWDAFLAAYGRVRNPRPALTHFTFWTIAALARSARIRLSRPTGAEEEPLRRLRRLLARCS